MIGDAPAEPTNVTEEKMDVKPAKARSGRKKAPGEAPAKPEGVAEGDEAASAKLMSRSLLSRLRDRFAEDDKTATQGEATSSAPPTSDAALDTAATSLDAVKEEVKEGDKPDVDMADGDGEAAPV